MRKSANLGLVDTEAPAPLFGSTKVKRRAKHHKFPTEAQVEALAKAARNHRDRTMIMTAYRHGLRVSELVSLKWDQIDLEAATMRIYRAKHGRDATHPIPGSELRELRRLKRGGCRRVCVHVASGRTDDRASVRSDAREDGRRRAGLPGPFNPHSLRHACGYFLASAGRSMRDIQHYLGHRDLKSTEIYTRSGTDQFSRLFQVG
jgi:type 1 fimbriae regulatory protein FimE